MKWDIYYYVYNYSFCLASSQLSDVARELNQVLMENESESAAGK